jgi:teichoic acid transport system ATP-binding protein
MEDTNSKDFNKNLAINVKSLTKIYPLYNSSRDRLFEALHPRRKKYHKDFFALKDLSFQVEKGDFLGIIGQNGSGKSTLLKVISRVLTPTSGSFKTSGRVISLLELGSGFNHELTGLENIRFYGTILGFKKKEIEARMEQIIAFADIGQFINQPLKTYSTGMRSRLAFSVASNVDPDILILDEVLAVGDIRFKQKCYRVMREIVEQKKTVLLVTHSMGAVTSFCNKAIWLNAGELMEYGEASEVVKKYSGYMTYGSEDTSETIKSSRNFSTGFKDNDTNPVKNNDVDNFNNLEWTEAKGFESVGEYGCVIESFLLCYHKSLERVKTISGGEWLSLYIKIRSKEEMMNLGVGFRISDRLGRGILTINNYLYNISLDSIKPGDSAIVRSDFRFPLLKKGKYTITIAITDGDQHEHVKHHLIHDAILVTLINKDPKFQRGILALDNEDYKIIMIKNLID